MRLNDLTSKILGGGMITRDEAMSLLDAPLEDLRISSKAITERFFKEKVELCCISNGKYFVYNQYICFNNGGNGKPETCQHS